MIVQFIKQNSRDEKFYDDIIARIKITRNNKYILNTIREGSYVDVLGVTYKVMHTMTINPIKNTGFTTPIYNVYVNSNGENFNGFYPTCYLPSEETINECKDYFVRSKL